MKPGELRDSVLFLVCKRNALNSILRYGKWATEESETPVSAEQLAEIRKDIADFHEMYGKSSIRYKRIFGPSKKPASFSSENP